MTSSSERPDKERFSMTTRNSGQRRAVRQREPRLASAARTGSQNIPLNQPLWPVIHSVAHAQEPVLPLVVVDNSFFSPTGLTGLVTLLILASQGRSPSFPFQTARILMALHVFVFVFLLVVCLFLCLARLGRLDWFPLWPSSSKGAAKRPRLHRLLKKP
jgi:hypothetical protein